MQVMTISADVQKSRLKALARKEAAIEKLSAIKKKQEANIRKQLAIKGSQVARNKQQQADSKK